MCISAPSFWHLSQLSAQFSSEGHLKPTAKVLPFPALPLCSGAALVPSHLQEQLPQALQLGLELLVVVFKDLHARLQAAFVLPKDPGLSQQLLIAVIL